MACIANVVIHSVTKVLVIMFIPIVGTWGEIAINDSFCCCLFRSCAGVCDEVNVAKSIDDRLRLLGCRSWTGAAGVIFVIEDLMIWYTGLIFKRSCLSC